MIELFILNSRGERKRQSTHRDTHTYISLRPPTYSDSTTGTYLCLSCEEVCLKFIVSVAFVGWCLEKADSRVVGLFEVESLMNHCPPFSPFLLLVTVSRLPFPIRSWISVVEAEPKKYSQFLQFHPVHFISIPTQLNSILTYAVYTIRQPSPAYPFKSSCRFQAHANCSHSFVSTPPSFCWWCSTTLDCLRCLWLWLRNPRSRSAFTSTVFLMADNRNSSGIPLKSSIIPTPLWSYSTLFWLLHLPSVPCRPRSSEFKISVFDAMSSLP